MADQLPGPLRRGGEGCAQQGTEAAALACSGLDHSQNAVGSEQAGAFCLLEKVASKSMHHASLAVALPEMRLAFEKTRGQRFDRNDGVADGANAANSSRAEQRVENLGKNVSVFVGIEVSDLHSGRLNLSDLRNHFGDQLITIEASEPGARGEGGEAGVELLRLGRANRPQGVDGMVGRYRGPVDQHHVAADRKARGRTGQWDGG